MICAPLFQTHNDQSSIYSQGQINTLDVLSIFPIFLKMKDWILGIEITAFRFIWLFLDYAYLQDIDKMKLFSFQTKNIRRGLVFLFLYITTCFVIQITNTKHCGLTCTLLFFTKYNKSYSKYRNKKILHWLAIHQQFNHVEEMSCA